VAEAEEGWDMLRVRDVSGPAAAAVHERVTYRVTAFNEPALALADATRVSWLIKGGDGAALAHLPHQGPVLQLTVPDSWAGQTAIVMPYMNSPSAGVSVRTAVAPRLGPPPPGASRRVHIVRESSRFYASIDGEPRFYLGHQVRYGQRRGLMNANNPPGPRYRPEEYAAAHGDWAWYLLPTITCESKGHFTCLNTYDRAAFTFGHIQLGAHTPDDNFVSFFRELLAQPAAAEYFPDLTIAGGRIHRRTDAGPLVPLESPQATTALMAYFNPTPAAVDDEEAERAARLVDWCLRHRPMRDLQVAFAVREQRRKLAAHARRLPLDGIADRLCLVVLDILHQGRGKYALIARALRSSDPFDALLGIGATHYGERLATLRAGIRDLEAQGRVGQKVYDRASGEFVVPSGT
jgi:hypothetical protein